MQTPRIIRIRDQKLYYSFTDAAADIDTPYNYLAKCVREGKPCKGEYFEFYHGVGKNTSPEELEKLIQQKQRIKKLQSDSAQRLAEQITEQKKWDKEFQKLLKIMKSRAEALDISLDEYSKDFVKYMTERDMLS